MVLPKVTPTVVFWPPYTHEHVCTHTGTHKTHKQNCCHQRPTTVALGGPILRTLTCPFTRRRKGDHGGAWEKGKHTRKEPSTSREKLRVLSVHGPLQPWTSHPCFWPQVEIRGLVARLPPGQLAPPSSSQVGMWQKIRKMRKDRRLAWLKLRGSQNRTLAE